MVDIKNVIHTMRVKWLNRLCLDRGQSWSRMAWSQITKYILDTLLPGLTGVCKSDIQKIPPFYAAVLHSYCHINSLFYQRNPKLALSHKLFGTDFAPKIRQNWVCAGLLMITDLPLHSGKIDF